MIWIVFPLRLPLIFPFLRVITVENTSMKIEPTVCWLVNILGDLDFFKYKGNKFEKINNDLKSLFLITCQCLCMWKGPCLLRGKSLKLIGFIKCHNNCFQIIKEPPYMTQNKPKVTTILRLIILSKRLNDNLWTTLLYMLNKSKL